MLCVCKESWTKFITRTMLKIHCKEKWCKALTASREHYDKTFAECIMRLMGFYSWEGVTEVNIYSDHAEHSFYFEVIREDGSRSMNGGMIFHGFPGEGYQQNGSVQLSRSYGWSIHT